MPTGKSLTEQDIPFEKITGSVDVTERLRIMNSTQRHAVLATVSESGPYTSLIAFAMTPDMKNIVFATPKTTNKYRHMQQNKDVSLLIDTRKNTDGDYRKAEAVNLIGAAKPVKKGKRWDELSKILIKKHPVLKKFVHAPTTVLILVEVRRRFHVCRFQSISH